MNSAIAVYMCLVFGANGDLLDDVRFDTNHMVANATGQSTLILSDQHGIHIRGWADGTWSSFQCDKYEPSEGDEE
jgi:hypothetical protein